MVFLILKKIIEPKIDMRIELQKVLWQDSQDRYVFFCWIFGSQYFTPFINQHLLTDSLTKISQLDVILLASNVHSFSFKTLFMHFIVDINTELFNLYLCYIHLFNSNYQDIYSVVLLLSPELVLGFNDFFASYFFSAGLGFTPSAVFDSYVNNLNYSFSEGIISFIMFVFYI